MPSLACFFKRKSVYYFLEGWTHFYITWGENGFIPYMTYLIPFNRHCERAGRTDKSNDQVNTPPDYITLCEL